LLLPSIGTVPFRGGLKWLKWRERHCLCGAAFFCGGRHRGVDLEMVRMIIFPAGREPGHGVRAAVSFWAGHRGRPLACKPAARSRGALPACLAEWTAVPGVGRWCRVCVGRGRSGGWRGEGRISRSAANRRSAFVFTLC
jgi:hypothetical protein